jgi:hypothetical protein
VVDGDKPVLTLAAYEQDPSFREDLQVVGDRRLRHVEALGDLTARQLAEDGDLLDHPKPSLVREGLEHAYQRLIVHESRPYRRGADGSRPLRRARTGRLTESVYRNMSMHPACVMSKLRNKTSPAAIALVVVFAPFYVVAALTEVVTIVLLLASWPIVAAVRRRTHPAKMRTECTNKS